MTAEVASHTPKTQAAALPKETFASRARPTARTAKSQKVMMLTYDNKTWVLLLGSQFFTNNDRLGEANKVPRAIIISVRTIVSSRSIIDAIPMTSTPFM